MKVLLSAIGIALMLSTPIFANATTLSKIIEKCSSDTPNQIKRISSQFYDYRSEVKLVVTGHANSSCLENHLEIAYKVVAEDASTRAVIYRYK